jgi:prespore-specific regulator
MRNLNGRGGGWMKGRGWTAEEDQLLKECVLNSIINGGTQVEAFEEVGKKLGRTPGACGFRWNAVLRQKDPISYTEAKKKRVYRQLQKKRARSPQTISQLIPFMKQMEKEGNKLKAEVKSLSQRVENTRKRQKELVEENNKLRVEMNSYQWYQKEVKDKYQHLIRLISLMKEQADFPIELKNDKRLQVKAEHEKGMAT